MDEKPRDEQPAAALKRRLGGSMQLRGRVADGGSTTTTTTTAAAAAASSSSTLHAAHRTHRPRAAQRPSHAPSPTIGDVVSDGPVDAVGGRRVVNRKGGRRRRRRRPSAVDGDDPGADRGGESRSAVRYANGCSGLRAVTLLSPDAKSGFSSHVRHSISASTSGSAATRAAAWRESSAPMA